MDSHSDRLTDYSSFNQSSRVFSGTEMIAHLNNINLGQEKLLYYVVSFQLFFFNFHSSMSINYGDRIANIVVIF